MNTTKGMHQLSEMFKDRDWFSEVGTDQYGRLVVYVKWNCEETLYSIPDKVEGIQVLVHFTSSKNVRREDFTSGTKAPVPLVIDVSNEAEYLGQEPDVEELPSSYLTSDIGELARELDRLERMCGSNVLQDIFYEVHDGKNAVTNLSAHHPEVRKSLEKLYNEYGFDVIYEEMDG